MFNLFKKKLQPPTVEKLNVGKITATFCQKEGGDFKIDFIGTLAHRNGYIISVYARDLFSRFLEQAQKEGFYHCVDGTSIPIHSVKLMKREYFDHFVEYESV